MLPVPKTEAENDFLLDTFGANHFLGIKREGGILGWEEWKDVSNNEARFIMTASFYFMFSKYCIYKL